MSNYNYPIDYDLFDSEEIVKLVEFFALIEDANERRVNADVLSAKHKEFRKLINSISLEKKIDRDFEKVSGYSIFKTINKHKKAAK